MRGGEEVKKAFMDERGSDYPIRVLSLETTNARTRKLLSYKGEDGVIIIIMIWK